jgi:hypothetical protein
MRGYVLTAAAIFAALVAILVTSMGWLETRAARIQPPAAPVSQPIVIQLPPQQSLSAPATARAAKKND